MLDDLVDHRPDGTQVIGATSTLGPAFVGALLLTLAAVVLLVFVASMSTFTRITVVICLVFFGGGALFAGNTMLSNLPLIQWGSWGLAVYNGRKVAWSAVRSMKVVTVFGGEYLAIWLRGARRIRSLRCTKDAATPLGRSRGPHDCPKSPVGRSGRRVAEPFGGRPQGRNWRPGQRRLIRHRPPSRRHCPPRPRAHGPPRIALPPWRFSSRWLRSGIAPSAQTRLLRVRHRPIQLRGPGRGLAHGQPAGSLGQIGISSRPPPHSARRSSRLRATTSSNVVPFRRRYSSASGQAAASARSGSPWTPAAAASAVA